MALERAARQSIGTISIALRACESQALERRCECGLQAFSRQISHKPQQEHRIPAVAHEHRVELRMIGTLVRRDLRESDSLQLQLHLFIKLLIRCNGRRRFDFDMQHAQLFEDTEGALNDFESLLSPQMVTPIG